MLFNSGIFLQFFAVFLLLYYVVRNNLAARNLLIVVASYVFYGAWDYRFLALLVISSVVDFYVARGLDRQEDPIRRKRLILISVALNLAFLGFFKYCDFFIESFADLLRAFGMQPNIHTLGIVLPVGISFYTFQTMSYTLDVYRRELPAASNLVQFLAYVSFFPQLVAGPIERARHLLPQFSATRVITIEMIREGLWLGIWGLFKKVVIADNLAPLVEMVYNAPGSTGGTVILATTAFALQIYCDFSGYSDIARGTARILGFDIMFNFDLPYSAASMREFWRRWHISLSTWLRDYLYIPLGGNRLGPARTRLNLFITMVLGGLWHGARWNFVLWGIWHGAALVCTRNTAPPRWSFTRWACTLAVVLYGWLLFRADSLAHIVALHRSFAIWSPPPFHYLLSLLIFSAPLVLMELWQRAKGNVLAPLQLPALFLGGLEAVLLIGILVFWEKQKVPFIYFQF